MEPQEIAAIEANLFPLVRTIVRDKPDFPWHRDARSRRSSQALAVDFFGTIGRLASRDAIVHGWISHMGLTLAGRGQWKIELEVPVPTELLGEQRPTQIDALAKSDSGLILFECKFTESGGGACSQPNAIPDGPHQGLKQCTGSYEEQINPVNQVLSRCALTGKRIKYWALLPEVMDIDPSVDHRPCPFSGSWPHGSWFQWMRNLVSALALGRSHQVPAAFVVVYADGRFPMALNVRGQDWVRLATAVADRAVSLRAVSYQQLLSLAQTVCAPAEGRVLDELAAWMAGKIEAAAAATRDPAVDADC